MVLACQAAVAVVLTLLYMGGIFNPTGNVVGGALL